MRLAPERATNYNIKTMQKLIKEQLSALECEMITGGWRQYAYTTSSGSVNATQYSLTQSVEGGTNSSPSFVPPIFGFGSYSYTAAPLNYSSVQGTTTGNSNTNNWNFNV